LDASEQAKAPQTVEFALAVAEWAQIPNKTLLDADIINVSSSSVTR
jgi:hypothetical protein